jgi:hypothetical protein
VFVVFVVSWPGRRVSRTQIYVPKAENNLDTKGWHGGAKKTAEKGGYKRPEAYTISSGNIIPWHWCDHEWWRV